MKDLFVLLFKKKKLTKSLVALFQKDAKTFGGVYNGLYSISEGKQKSFKALDEFHQRLSYLEGYEALKKTVDVFYPANEHSPKRLQEFAIIIMNAVKEANIMHSCKDEIIVLSDSNVLHYNELGNEELYVDDSVQVAIPAWSQGELLLEKGFCNLKK
ncbi:MAG: hypothetical protein IJG23_07410 [Clostridia bacterium]|nr:hypothetical protein [Clostridia bacterium]